MKTNHKKTAGVLLACMLFAANSLMGCANRAEESTQNEIAQEETTPDKMVSLADGSYRPDEFSWSGGSGRVSITCDEIKIENGQPYADIVFDSPYYSSVKLQDTVYEGTHTEQSSAFTIPVTLNEANTIFGMTTRMSAAHEIEYQICPYLAAGGQAMQTTKSSDEDPGDTAPAFISTAPPEIPGLIYERQMKLDYAKGFDVFYYQDGYVLINIYDSAQYLVVPEHHEVPEGMDLQIKVLRQPMDHIYLAATSAMALFRAMDSLDAIRLTGTKASGWYVEEAAEAMNRGEILFAGKYSEPDYELLLNETCDLAIESSMILHAPKVKEMLESVGIPVLIDRSSYEKHPLGRTEWIKLYGALLGREDAAEHFFDKQTELIRQWKDFKNTEKTVAFFSIDTNGIVVVRKSDDYIPRMIEIAGGRYVFDNLQNSEIGGATVSLSMEEFYAAARNADYLIYNGTIDSPLKSLDELLAKNELFADFDAVREGRVWTVGKDLYQSTDIVGQLIVDLHQMLTEDKADRMTFLEKVE